MGCGASPVLSPKNNVSNDPEDSWLEVCQTLDVPKGAKNPKSNVVVKRTGWKTIRVFVSSTFKDFHYERKILVKEFFFLIYASGANQEGCILLNVIYDGLVKLIDILTDENLFAAFHNKSVPLMNFSDHFHIIWFIVVKGVPKDSTSEVTLRMCLGEIDRCYQDNIMPYFINMTSKISCLKENDKNVFSCVHFSFIIFNSIYGMKESCNTLFPIMAKVFNFFKDRISQQYPLMEQDSSSSERLREQHESFMKNRCETVFGRQFCAKGGKYGLNVIYYFVSAVPGSTDLSKLLSRIVYEAKIAEESQVPSDLDYLVQMTCSALNNPNTKPIIIFIDALNQ
ncbi:hypothetical protein CAPTEDRAFT_217534, partial [Capitella teleta]